MFSPKRDPLPQQKKCIALSSDSLNEQKYPLSVIIIIKLGVRLPSYPLTLPPAFVRDFCIREREKYLLSKYLGLTGFLP